MKNSIPLTIITICYNIKDEIEKTCKSIVNQTWQDFEWIVVDGGSTDGTTDILKKYQNRMNVFISEPDKGIYNAMNKGILLAHGTWLNFMNGGDSFAADDVLEKVFKNTDYDADILYGDINLIYENGDVVAKPQPDNLEGSNYHFCHQASFIKKELFDKHGLYNENYRVVSDWEKFIIFKTHDHKFLHLNMIISDYMLTGISSRITPKLLAEMEKVSDNFFKKQTDIRLLQFFPLLRIEEQWDD